MLNIKKIKENPEEFDLAMEKRGIEPCASKIIELSEEKNQLITIIQKLQHARKEKASIIASLGNKKMSELKSLKKDALDIKNKLVELENKLKNNTKLDRFLASLPNIADNDVPFGNDEKDNVELRTHGTKPKFDFTPKEHYELGEELGMMDFVDTAKISGSRFVTLKTQLAQLERALANFMLDLHTKKFGFSEMSPPVMVKNEAMYNAGQLPKFAEDSYETTNNYRIIPTAEVPLVNYAAGKILEKEKLPIRYVAYTQCFRSEAGSAGRDTRGMLRQHQFSKVELVSFSAEENSKDEHEFITKAAEEVLKQLELPYRVMLLCSKDMGFTASKTYDLEVWLPGQNTYREISSCSNCEDFQGRRMNARYRSSTSKETSFVHTLNGSGIAIGRTIIAIMENYQNKDGSITIPKVLVPYMGGLTKITADA